jgi:hypothetical protein
MRRAISVAILTAMALLASRARGCNGPRDHRDVLRRRAGEPFPSRTVGRIERRQFANPLFATVFIESVQPYAGDGVNGPGVLITFDFDNPASKLAPHPTLDTFFVGDGTYISAFVFDSSHGFTNCVALRG